MEVEARHSRLALGPEEPDHQHYLPAVETSSTPLGCSDGSPVVTYPPNLGRHSQLPLQSQPLHLQGQQQQQHHHHHHHHQPSPLNSSSQSYPRQHLSRQQLIEPASMPSGDDAAVDSFELEEATTMTGGTSWTLRVPWLRSKRQTRQPLQEDENDSIQSIINPANCVVTNITSSLAKVAGGFVPPPNVEEDEPMYYYGGLMKTTGQETAGDDNDNDAAYSHENDPHAIGSVESSLSAGAGSLSVVGPVPDIEAAASPRVLQQQRQPQRQKVLSHQLQKIPRKHKKRRLLDGRRKSKLRAAATEAASSSSRQTYKHNPSSQIRYVLSEQQQYHNPHPESSLPNLADSSNTNRVFRNRSWLSYSSRGSSSRWGRRRKGSGAGSGSQATDDDSLADFDDTEWTPQDSAYGAAIPVCGWIPKRLRQVIEATLIALIVLLLVYIVVKTSITVSEGKASKDYGHNDTSSKSASTYDKGLRVDDDWYVENSHYDKRADDDDYFRNYDRGGNAGNGNR